MPKLRKSAHEVLERLCKLYPSARQWVGNAAGYAVFSHAGMEIAGGGCGGGAAVNDRARKETFMKMAEVQAGPVPGVSRTRLVQVFETRQAFDNFVSPRALLPQEG